MDYFQPLDKHAKLGVNWNEVREQVKYGMAMGAYLSLMLYIVVSIVFSNYPHIEQSLEYVGYGTVRPCQNDCGHCEQAWHQHYSKAWRKVK